MEIKPWVVRWVRTDPLLKTITVSILAIGVGATTAVFSIVDAVLLRPLPYASAERLVRVEENNRGGRALSGVPFKDYQRWASRNDIFERMTQYIRDTVTLTGGDEPEQVIAVRSLGLFPLLGVPPRLGRTLNDSDDEEGARNVAVLSDRLWRRRYHADPGVIGRGIIVSDEAYTIVGVMPADFEFRFSEAEMWTPLRLTQTTPWLQVAARLRAGVSLAQARSALEIVAHQTEEEEPKDRAGLKILLTPWSSMLDPKYKLTLILVLAAVGLVMLIACADVSGLLLIRAVRRQKEIAIRACLGAASWQVARHLLL